MPKLTITIATDNAAFDQDACFETARILRELAKHYDSYCLDETVKLRDVNGNVVGLAVYS